MKRKGIQHWAWAAAVVALSLAGAVSPVSAQFAMIRNINTSGDSNPAEYTAFAGGVYFSADDNDDHGRELWATDGIDAFLVADIDPGSSNSNPEFLTVSNGVLYFAAEDGNDDDDPNDHGTELWRSDGTEAGTVLAANIRSGHRSSDPRDLVDVDGVLYFSADAAGSVGRELYSYDGTTLTLFDINPGSDDSDPENLFNHNGVLFFSADDGDDGHELWKVEGGVLSMVRNIRGGSNSSDPQYFASLGTSGVVFSAHGGSSGRELWFSDGTFGNTFMVRDIESGSSSSSPTFMTSYGNEVIFSADANGGREPWITNGTLAGTVRLANVNTSGDSDPEGFYSYGGIVYFSAEDSDDREPYIYNGVEVELLADLGFFSGGSSNPAEFTGVGTKVYFSATDQWLTGRELYITEGTAGTTMVVQDINLGFFDDSNPHNLAAINGEHLFFTADNGTNNYEPWASSMANTLLVNLTEASATADSWNSPVTVAWTTASEIDNVGFLVYRANDDGSRGDLVSDGLIAAQGSPDSGASYEIVDADPLQGPDDDRQYFIVDVDLSGVETDNGPVPVRVPDQVRNSSVQNWDLY